MTNQMGDVIAVTESNGNVICEYIYDEWGNLLETCYVDAENAQQIAVANANPLRYRGYYCDTETGYYYLQSRYYDPSICRFINADVPEIAQLSKNVAAGTNLFAYCNNNPTNEKDYFGYLSIRTIISGFKSLGRIAWPLVKNLINKIIWKPGYLGLKIFEVAIDMLLNLLPFGTAFRFVSYKAVTKLLVETAFKNVGKSIVTFFVKFGLKIALNTLISTINKITFGGNNYRFFTAGGIICYLIDKYDGKVDYYFNYGKYRW